MNKHIWVIAAALAASLGADEPATINRARVNLRGGPSFASEVIGQLQKDDKVTFIEEVPVEKPKPGEPAKWAAIKLPPNTPVWVFNDFLNADKTVKVPRLNLRAGPGENYSLVGRLQRGDSVKSIREVEGWTQIETPESARAYVDASYITRVDALKVYEPPKKPETVSEAPKPQPTVIKEEPPIVATPPPKVEERKPTPLILTGENPAPSPVALSSGLPSFPAATKPAPTVTATTNKPAVTATPPPKPAPTTTPVEEKPAEVTRVLPQVAPPIQSRTTNTVTVKRVVRREGEVRSTKFNIQAPTYFELVNVDNGKVINYLSGEKAGFKLKDYKGLKVIVTGEEFIEPRYPERPLLEIETIEVAP
jgi:uncharacterized protein YgiM (DUF1202 family)